MKNAIVLLTLICVTLPSHWLTGCNNSDGNSLDVTELKGMWEMEMAEDANTCPEDKKKKDDETMYLLIEVSDDKSEITLYDCEDETEDSCENTGDTYDLDGSSLSYEDVELTDLGIKTVDCSIQGDFEIEISFTSESEFTGTMEATMSVVGDDATECIGYMKKYSDESMDGCTIEGTLTGTKL